MNKMQSNLILVGIVLLASANIGADRNSYRPKKGYVPDEQTAIAIAVAVWTPIYGKEQIESEKPYKASLKNGVWTVTGSLPKGYLGAQPKQKYPKVMVAS